MRVVQLQDKDREKLRELESEREEAYKRMTAARQQYDALLKAIAVAITGAKEKSYSLDETGNYMIVGQGGEYRSI